MRDLKPSDRIERLPNGKCRLHDGHGTVEPMCWKDPRDYIQWMIRQVDLGSCDLTPEQKMVLDKMLELMNQDQGV